MTLFEQARAVDDRHRSGIKLRPRIAGTERRQRRELRHHALADVAERQRPVEPQAWPQIVWAEDRVGMGVHRLPEFPDARAFELQPGGGFVTAESLHQRRARFETREHVKAGNAAARSMRDL